MQLIRNVAVEKNTEMAIKIQKIAAKFWQWQRLSFSVKVVLRKGRRMCKKIQHRPNAMICRLLCVLHR